MDILELRINLKEKEEEMKDKVEEVEEALEEEDVEKAKKLKEELDEIKAEVEALQNKIEKLEEELENLEKEDENDDVEDDEEEEEKEERSGFKMEKRKVLNEQNNKEVRAFYNYLQKRAITDGVTTDGNQVIIPEDVKGEIIDLVADRFNLKDIVTVEPVKNASGKRKTRTNTDVRLSSVEELSENPEIAVTELEDVNYEIETKRGYVPISQEAIDDGVMTLEQIKAYIGEVATNTENHDIMQVLSGITGKQIGTVDELKDIVNVELPVSVLNDTQFLIPQTVYNEIDKLKDDNGKYLLQPSISSPSGFALFGRDVIVMDDAQFPTKNTGFVGNFKEVIYFDRQDLRVEWTNYMHYGQCLSPILRNDVKLASQKANIKKFIFKPEVDAGKDA